MLDFTHTAYIIKINSRFSQVFALYLLCSKTARIIGVFKIGCTSGRGGMESKGESGSTETVVVHWRLNGFP